jgi:hypothetical protein
MNPLLSFPLWKRNYVLYVSVGLVQVNNLQFLLWFCAGNFALDTLYFAEYESQGPGANPQARVNWSTQITDPSELAKFSVNNFLNAQEWLLPDTSR